MLGQGVADCHARISALFRMKSVLYSRSQRSAKVANAYAVQERRVSAVGVFWARGLVTGGVVAAIVVGIRLPTLLTIPPPAGGPPGWLRLGGRVGSHAA